MLSLSLFASFNSIFGQHVNLCHVMLWTTCHVITRLPSMVEQSCIIFPESSAVEGHLLTNIWWYSSEKKSNPFLTPTHAHTETRFFTPYPRFSWTLFFLSRENLLKKKKLHCVRPSGADLPAPPACLLRQSQLFGHVSIEVCSFFNTFGRCAQLLFMAIAFGLESLS